MPSLFERVRDAVAPRYEVEGEVASGGMATVFRALDTSLDRVVAVKVLRPDMATATAEARFLREARTLASFSHPNIVTIHDADQHDGLFYYVMDLVKGESLARRLEAGPLDGRDAFRLGRDLLDALERMHAVGMVHRDVKPSNVFLIDGRALLADFGIVHVEDPPDDTLTTEGRGPGTPAYMSPEQATGGGTSARSDLYSLALVLYESLSGRRWTAGMPPESGDWSGIPVPARPALKRALALDPEDRWNNAADFRDALRTRGPGLRLPRWAVALVAAAIVALGWWALGRPGAPARAPMAELSDLAVFPCAEAGLDGAESGEELGWRVALNLEDVPGITTASRQAAFSLYERRAGEVTPADWAGSLHASHAVRCTVDRIDGGLDIDMRLLDEEGIAVSTQALTVRADSEPELMRRAAVAISMHVLDALAPGVTVTEEEVDRFEGYPIGAIRPFFWGDHALRRGAWRSAERRYEEALAADPSFTLARLRLAEVRRWLVDRPIGEDLAEIRNMDLSSLSPLDSLLLEAGAKPHGPAQLTAYEGILARPEYRRDAYATMLYADELYHRGGLWGVPLDSAVSLFRRAVRQDSSLVPAVEHLTQALIRTGQEAEAAAALQHLEQVHPPRGESDLYYPDVWGQGFLEKFHPDNARQNRSAMADLPLETLGLYARWVRYIDSPSTQAELGALLVNAADRLGSPEFAAQGFIDRGIGLIGQGLIDEGVASFDSAALRFGTDETVAQAAEWAVIPHALGVEGFSSANAERGERVLADLWRRSDLDPRLQARVATALALGADRRGDEPARRAWAARLDSLQPPVVRAGAQRTGRLLAALASASSGGYREALEGTAVDLAYDSAGIADRPFLRSALYLKRGEWYRELGMPDSAIASWLWYENTDLEGTIPPHQVQAGEVDGALGFVVRGRITRAAAGSPE